MEIKKLEKNSRKSKLPNFRCCLCNKSISYYDNLVVHFKKFHYAYVHSYFPIKDDSNVTNNNNNDTNNNIDDYNDLL